jgi:hypothetical protein
MWICALRQIKGGDSTLLIGGVLSGLSPRHDFIVCFTAKTDISGLDGRRFDAFTPSLADGSSILITSMRLPGFRGQRSRIIIVARSWGHCQYRLDDACPRHTALTVGR